MKGAWLGCLILFPAALAHAKGARLLTEIEEAALGREAASQIQRRYGDWEAESVRRYLSEVGFKAAAQAGTPRGQRLSFSILRSSEPQVFTLPGGNIFITLGFLRLLGNEAELAALLAHEVAHAAGFHPAQSFLKRYGKEALREIREAVSKRDLALLRGHAESFISISREGFGRRLEEEADRTALDILISTGYDPRALVTLLTKIQTIEERDISLIQNYINGHPPTQQRLRDARQALRERLPDYSLLITNQNQFHNRLISLLPKPQVPQDILEERRFESPLHRVRLILPENWEIFPSETAMCMFRRKGSTSQGELVLYEDIEETHEDLAERVVSSLKKMERLSTEGAFIAGRWGKRVLLRRSPEGGSENLLYEMFFVKRGKEAFALTVAYPEGAAKELAREIQQILKGLKLK